MITVKFVDSTGQGTRVGLQGGGYVTSSDNQKVYYQGGPVHQDSLSVNVTEQGTAPYTVSGATLLPGPASNTTGASVQDGDTVTFTFVNAGDLHVNVSAE